METDLKRIRQLSKKKEDVLTLGMLSRIDAVDDTKLNREKKEDLVKSIEVLQDLTMRERGEVRQLFTGNEGHVDIEVEFTCPECEYEWKADMPVGQPSFFFPSGT